MSAFLRKYATATATGTHIGIPMIKAGSQSFAVAADWTPAAGDVLLSINGGTQVNITALPTYINGQWFFQFTAPELTGKSICVSIVDSGPKAVEDQFFIIETFGHTLAQFAVDFSDKVRFGLTALPNVDSGNDGAIPTTGNGNNQIVLTNGLVTLAVGTHVGAIIPTVNNLTNLPALPAGWITAGSIATAALNGKGDWLTTIGSTAPANWINAASITTSALNGKGDWLTTLGSTAPIGWINAASIVASALNGKGDWLTTLGSNAPTNWINAASIATSALNGKGDWLTTLGSSAPDNWITDVMLADGSIDTATFASGATLPRVSEVDTVNDKTGYQLDIDGLEIISLADPLDFDDITTLPKVIKAIFWKLFGHGGQTETEEITRNGSDTVFATQSLSDDGVTQIRGKAF